MDIIFNADDFGSSPEVNEAVQQAYQLGVLTSTSLMATGPAFEDAVYRARQMPGLAVGLHLVLTEGRPLVEAGRIRHLVDARGGFFRDPAAAGLRFFFIPAARQELALEIRAQFERFAAAGLPLSHVDGHQNMHVHPVVFPILLPLAEKYGASGIRIPADDLKLDLQYDCSNLAMKAVWTVFFGLLSRWCLARLRSHPLKTASHVYGLLQSGNMQEAYVLHLLRRLKDPSAELYFHPSLACQEIHLGPNRGDLSTLVSPRVRRAIAERSLRLCSYPSLSHSRRPV
jgi:hopanoid biosynthesis associated protein HpnK